jgi:murein DD-endopeptidase MepM/ murein hydrolase activator NlpD
MRTRGLTRLGLAVAAVAAMLAPASAVPLPHSLTAPVAPACISSPFGPRWLPGTRAARFHTGIDFPAPAGAWVHAVADGRVAVIRRLGADGLEVDVIHGTNAADRFTTRYAHLGSVTATLARGKAAVTAGQRLGRVGRSGITYGTHVHFELRIAGAAVDPEAFFATPRCHPPSDRR